MSQPSLAAMLQQQLSQLETLEVKQLNELLNKLEEQREKLPIEDHSVLNWGISFLRARIQDEEQFMSEMDIKWEALKQKYSPHSYKAFVSESDWDNFNLNREVDKDKLYESGWDNFQNILGLCVEEDRIRLEFQDRVKDFSSTLKRFCQEKNSKHLFNEFIEDYIASCNSANRSTQYYEKLAEVLRKSV